jgi:hypothetical protein
MGITELSNVLGIDKSVVSRLVQKGMPVTSVDAAQAWREQNAKPRAKRGQAGTPPPPPTPSLQRITTETSAAGVERPSESPTTSTIDPETEQAGESAASLASLTFARLVERVAKNELAKCSRNPNSSVEDFRKATQTCIAARNNAEQARKARSAFLHEQRTTLYLSEAREIMTGINQTAATMLGGMAKQLAPRLAGQPAPEIERTLGDWAETVMEVLRKQI